MKRNAGFSLIEIMIAVVIIAILTTVALPMYGAYVKRGKITEATSTLSGMRARMEQYYQDNRTYQTNPVSGSDCGVVMPVAPEVKYFSYTCAAAGPNVYLITATGTAASGMANFSYTINQQNVKASVITESGWTGNASCWAIKQDGSC